ncbi:MAG: TetR/AcrR family transcriptional regulator, transcriptional repressor for nem operon [Acidimicrobiaceae bacterium]|jgi:AcrR family transcriptional regulator
MSGRRAYTNADVVVAAKQVFWDRGYEGTAVDDLQDATGLSRSSLYLAFDTKRAVFDAALTEYVTSFVDPRLGLIEAPDAGLREVAAFFRGLADYFRGPDADRGCLLINAIAELAGRDPSFSPVAADFTRRVRAAFANALGHAAADGAMNRKQVSRRTEMLTVSLFGVWIAVRSDAADAAATCRSIAQEVTSWGVSPTRSR